MLLRFLLSAILLFVLAPASQSGKIGDPFEALREGMLKHSDSRMQVFFESWFQLSKPLRKKPKTHLQKEAEVVLETIWNPANRHTLSWGWDADSITHQSLPPFIVLWPSVQIFNDSDAKPTDSLVDMFPTMLHGATTLVYDETYVASLNKYLRYDSEHREENQNYISKFTSFSCHLSGCGVRGEPIISSIAFKKDRHEALVHLWMEEMEISTTLRKDHLKWKILGRQINGEE